MPVSPVEIAMLSSPLPPEEQATPFTTSEWNRNQSISGAGAGNTTHQMPFGDASSIQISADVDAVNQAKELESPGVAGRDYDQNVIGGEAQTTVGGNVGGVVSGPEKAGPTFIPEELDPFSIKEQRYDMQDVATEGYEGKEGKRAMGKYKRDQMDELRDLKKDGTISKDEFKRRKENLKLARRRERRKWGD